MNDCNCACNIVFNVCLSICLSFCLSVCPSVHLSVCLSVCLLSYLLFSYLSSPLLSAMGDSGGLSVEDEMIKRMAMAISQYTTLQLLTEDVTAALQRAHQRARVTPIVPVPMLHSLEQIKSETEKLQQRVQTHQEDLAREVTTSQKAFLFLTREQRHHCSTTALCETHSANRK